MDNGRNNTDRTMLGTGEVAGSRPPLVGAPATTDRAVRSVEISAAAAVRDGVEPAWLGSHQRDRGRATTQAMRSCAPGASSATSLTAVAPRRVRPRRPPDPVSGHAGARRAGLEDVAALRRPPVRRALPACPPASRCGFAPRGPASLPTGRNQLVVLDLDTGADKARVDIPPRARASCSPRGFGRDVYYQSLTTIARVAVRGPA